MEDMWETGYDKGYEEGLKEGLRLGNQEKVKILSLLLLDSTISIEDFRNSIQKELRQAIDAWEPKF